jgi:hypothetical protein
MMEKIKTFIDNAFSSIGIDQPVNRIILSIIVPVFVGLLIWGFSGLSSKEKEQLQAAQICQDKFGTEVKEFTHYRSVGSVFVCGGDAHRFDLAKINRLTRDLIDADEANRLYGGVDG